jgi:hypothetical protein
MVGPGRLSNGVLGQLDELAHPQDESALHLDLGDHHPPGRLARSQVFGLGAGPVPVPPPMWPDPKAMPTIAPGLSASARMPTVPGKSPGATRGQSRATLAK